MSKRRQICFSMLCVVWCAVSFILLRRFHDINLKYRNSFRENLTFGNYGVEQTVCDPNEQKQRKSKVRKHCKHENNYTNQVKYLRNITATYNIFTNWKELCN